MTPPIFGRSGLVLSADERAFFREADPAGYIIFGRNVESRQQLRARRAGLDRQVGHAGVGQTRAATRMQRQLDAPQRQGPVTKDMADAQAKSG